MNNKALISLEFNKIKEILKKYSVTFMGEQKIDDLLPTSNIKAIHSMQKETTEAVSILLRKNSIPIVPVSDIKQILDKVNIGATLLPSELLNIADVLRTSRKLKEYFFNSDIEAESYERLSEYFENLYTNISIEDEISRCIKNEDELDDRASKELYDIRKSIGDLETKIKNKLNDIIHSSSTSKFLQDSVVTFRNDRYVVPVKQEYRNEIPGLIHDSSSSGSTLFIEPNAIFDMNNGIKELKIKEQLEIERILALLTQMVSPLTSLILDTMSQIGEIDFIFAKAKYSIETNSFEPIIHSDGYCNFKKARHPLIAPDKVVPIDVWFGKDFNSLIITGPNTGGKTVTLKTIGLLCIMAQSGLHIPASENTEVCVFENIYTDIGDEQSIEQSLSTFSAHMTNIVNILNNVTEKDLVLIDELGSGTDPVEGAALAMSILEYLYSINCKTIATTHYSELKTFAIQTAGIENASCEFDIETLRPTYKLLIGIPGKSNAFAISQKLGLNQKIIERANTFLTEDNIKFEDVLSDMEHNRRKAHEERELSQKLLNEATKTKEQITDEKEKFEKKKAEILANAKQKARDILLDAENEANEIIKELTKLKKSNSSSVNKQAEEKRNELKKSISDIQKDLILPNSENINPISPDKIQVGIKVHIPSLNQDATVVSKPDKKQNIIVQSGLVKLTIHISQVELLKKEETKNKAKAATQRISNKSQNISTEIKLLGMTVDEAVNELDKYLDSAYLSSISIVRVVHGKGTGLLRKGIHQYLKSHPHVKSYRLGLYGEGDTGVTIVELK